MRLIIGIAILAFSFGCATEQKQNHTAGIKEKVAAELDTEISLKSDRKELEKLRKNVPEERRKENDELSYILELMGEPKMKPSHVRRRYQKALRNIRNRFRKKKNKLRENFRKEERKRREDFLKEAKSQREEIKEKNIDKDQKKEFYEEQKDRRREFFAEERERRQLFESEVRDKSNAFNSEMREKKRMFDEQYREYSKRYREHKKNKKETKFQKQGPSSSGKSEFEGIGTVPATPLKAGQEN